ncbi:hypothetical protein [Agrobacterium vitis]|uniref:hypothetical protein n=1 Tax=Agrobacterium vitis TaxID=373 RepID=UPI0012E866B1|nr:hypothetical protein [Agrobacterium vitis]MVA64082.1 hypothetical protein [Agrobacterium vitis]
MEKVANIGISLNIAVLGAGHVGTALAAWFSSQGATTTLWAPHDHPGILSSAFENKAHIRSEGLLEGTHEVAVADSLESAVESASLLVVATRSDAHQGLVEDLRRLGARISGKEILVICGRGFAIRFAHLLQFDKIVETDNSPVTSKLIGMSPRLFS